MCSTLKEKRSGVAPEMRARAQMRAHRVQSDDVNESNATRVDRREESVDCFRGRGESVDHCRGVDRGRVSRGVTRGGRVYD